MTPLDSIDHDVLRARVRRTLTRLSITGELPTLPAAATSALALARDPGADLQSIVRLVGADVALAARIMRVANSAGYGRRVAAKTLVEAVGTIGLRKTCDLLVVASTLDLFRGPLSIARALWDHALVSAIAAEELARVSRRVTPSAAFLPGLFHDVGRLAILLADPVAGQLIRDLASAGEGQACDLEAQWFGFTHAEASAILASEWGLDAAQADAIRWHHDPERAGAGRELATVLLAADRLAYGLGYGERALGPAEEPDAGATLGGLTPDATSQCAARVQESFAEQSALLAD